MPIVSSPALLEAHVAIQLGTYFDDVTQLGSGVKYASSSLVKDFYWNYAYDIVVDVENVPEMVGQVRARAEAVGRDAVLYTTPDSRPEGLADALSVKSQEDEVWLTLNSVVETKGGRGDVIIERLKNSAPSEEFLAVFTDAYGDGEPGSPGYVALPGEYVKALARCCPREGTEVAHFLGRVSERAVAISSIFCKPPFAGLYNVGTIHAARGNRYGYKISIAAVEFALGQGCNTIFLQTQPTSPVEDLYRKMGFERCFIGTFLVL